MKKYPTKAYYNYARKLLEGDAAVADSKIDADFKSVDNSQFKKLVIGASTGIVGAFACLKYLDRYFSINSLQSACDVLKQHSYNVAREQTTVWKNHLAMQGKPNEIGFFRKISGPIAKAIHSALDWVRRMAAAIVKENPFLGKPIVEGSSATYGSVLCMALAAAAVGAVIYKIYRVIKNRISSAVDTAESFVIKQERRIKKALAESTAMFKELSAVTLKEDLTDRMLQISKDNAEYQARKQAANVALGKINAASAAADPAGLVNNVTGKPAAGIGFINKVKAWVMTMWNDTKNFVRYHPTLCIVVGICAALIACWYGTKKYMESKGDSIAESFRPARRTRRMVRKSAYSF